MFDPIGDLLTTGSHGQPLMLAPGVGPSAIGRPATLLLLHSVARKLTGAGQLLIGACCDCAHIAVSSDRPSRVVAKILP